MNFVVDGIFNLLLTKLKYIQVEVYSDVSVYLILSNQTIP